MSGHAQLKFVMTECSKTQIRLAGLNCLFEDENNKRVLNPDSIKIPCGFAAYDFSALMRIWIQCGNAKASTTTAAAIVIFCLRNRSDLAVSCWVIIHCLEVSCKEDQITVRSASDLSAYNWPVNYYSTINTQELIYFDSNTQETMKKYLYPSNSSNFQSLHWRNPAKSLTVLQAFTCISSVYNE